MMCVSPEIRALEVFSVSHTDLTLTGNSACVTWPSSDFSEWDLETRLIQTARLKYTYALSYFGHELHVCLCTLCVAKGLVLQKKTLPAYVSLLINLGLHDLLCVP